MSGDHGERYVVFGAYVADFIFIIVCFVLLSVLPKHRTITGWSGSRGIAERDCWGGGGVT